MKLTVHEVRPAYMWGDILSTACNGQFGSPSGHSIDAFVFSMTLILDLFAPSKWSREVFPSLNTREVSTRKLLIIILGFALPYQALIVTDRLYLGKHTLNQTLFGSLLGLWLATCLHFCLRDKIYHHISLITNAPLGLADADAKKYAIRAVSLTAIILLVVTVIAHISVSVVGFNQT